MEVDEKVNACNLKTRELHYFSIAKNELMWARSLIQVTY